MRDSVTRNDGGPTLSAVKPSAAKPSVGGVQSVERTLDLLQLLAEGGAELGLSELAEQSGLPLPTIHRLMRTLVGRGYVRQEPSRRYALGPRLIQLGERASRMLGSWARPLLADLVDATGETANLAMLDGDDVVYVAQVPSRHAMRMFTEVGRRVLPHCTGVGKVLLAKLPEAEVRAIVARTGMPAQTSRTITSPDALVREIVRTRKLGYAVDEGEQEVGVRCVAVAVPDPATSFAVSISGPDARVSTGRVPEIVPVLQRVAEAMAHYLAYGEPGRAT